MLNSNDLELKIRIVKGEIREKKREKEKCLDSVISLIGCLLGLIIGSFYYKQEIETKIWLFFIIILLGLSVLFLSFYWYNRYQKTKGQIKNLEKELVRLKKEVK